MLGRSVDSSFVEDSEQDGPVYTDARDRWALDAQRNRIYVADDLPTDDQDVIYDFELPVLSKIRTKDFFLGSQFHDWNKLFTRTYLKARFNRIMPEYMERTFVDGVLVEAINREVASFDGNFDTRPFVMYPTFPVTRLRGRVIRKEFETPFRVSIGSFTVFFKVERRRI
jgi:hypothetical protein